VDNVKFMWLDGHAFEQAMPDHYLPDDVPKTASGAKRWRIEDLPIVPVKWEIMPKEQKARRLAVISDELKRCDLVWHMGDPDEEGQA
jgi:DNA topoisomerase-3